jgi:hypothetical protein
MSMRACSTTPRSGSTTRRSGSTVSRSPRSPCAWSRRRPRGREALVGWLREETGESRAWVERRLDADLPPAERQRLLVACDNDPGLAERVAPFGGLLRRDLRGDPLVYLPGSTYVTKASERRSSGTYYTPRALAEEVVRHTLDPLVHRPGRPRGQSRPTGGCAHPASCST